MGRVDWCLTNGEKETSRGIGIYISLCTEYVQSNYVYLYNAATEDCRLFISAWYREVFRVIQPWRFKSKQQQPSRPCLSPSKISETVFTPPSSQPRSFEMSIFCCFISTFDKAPQPLGTRHQYCSLFSKRFNYICIQYSDSGNLNVRLRQKVFSRNYSVP
ncbi:uncharacterized protein MCYG_00763 [Microsporum canis CBS 113480]|uniref:Uncharacterized protein n=1 Tax=Arthroderma otae (strain ATCC MYA-4605 / CBS 113480) TaxID=554155 RepID=C5FDS9_ARTOC|nr:uncharacterized protein MCYG_00763 [Microsporum canis CBS 113480]EEQ27875.1 predicted protein [Microsporum canis CBS 113480]